MSDGEALEREASDRQVLDAVRIPVVEEALRVDRRTVELERLRVHVGTEERDANVSELLAHEALDVERVPIDRIVDAPPPIRKEGDRLIVPVLEERLVVERRLVLVEELHVLRRREERPVEVPVTLRRTTVSVERAAPDGPTDEITHTGEIIHRGE